MIYISRSNSLWIRVWTYFSVWFTYKNFPQSGQIETKMSLMRWIIYMIYGIWKGKKRYRKGWFFCANGGSNLQAAWETVPVWTCNQLQMSFHRCIARSMPWQWLARGLGPPHEAQPWSTTAQFQQPLEERSGPFFGQNGCQSRAGLVWWGWRKRPAQWRPGTGWLQRMGCCRPSQNIP